MKKMIRLASILFLFLFIGGCPPTKPTPPPTPPLFYQHLSKGERAEAKKDLAQALAYYKKALIIAPRKSSQQITAHQKVLRVERQINLAKQYCQKYKMLMKAGKLPDATKALKQVRHIWPFYSKCNVSPAPDTGLRTLPDVGSYRILNKKPVIHKIRRGDIISKLCQRYYGLTGNYKLVHIITHYNKIDSKSLHQGQQIKFPWIQLNGHTYKPKGSHAQRAPAKAVSAPAAPKPAPSPTISPEPVPTLAPQLTVTPTPAPEPVSYYNQALELFRKEQYTDAVAMLDNAPAPIPEKEDSLRLLAQCHFRLALISTEKGRYTEARDTFYKALQICQSLQGPDLPPECGQIEDWLRKCDVQILTKAIEEHLNRGKQLLNASRIDPAIAEFEKVLASEPRHSDALEYLYLAHFRKANRLWKDKAYQNALEEFMTAWEYNQNCEDCQISINKIKGVLYRKAKGLEKKLDEPNAPVIKIFQEQIRYYTIIYQVDPDYEDVAVLLKRVRKRKKVLLEQINRQQPDQKK